MKIFAAIAALGVSCVCQKLSVGSWSCSLNPAETNLTELASRLTPGAQIFFPGTDGYGEATSRWSSYASPGVSVVVVPSVEEDVAETVRYANAHSKPFLAISGGHGAITTVGRMQNGIEIWMHQLSGVNIAEDGITATIGGGALSKNVTDTLWAAGKQTVTGACECTSLLGPGLGGGHGFLQGRHGLILDQFVSMNVVFADGNLRTIDENTDLWWAMKGAGHNFGIVTSVTSKIYDIQNRDWAYEMFMFTDDKVEGFYENLNEILNNGSPPVNIASWGSVANRPEIDSKPVITWRVLQEGTTAVDSIYTQPFHDLGPLVTGADNGTYLDLPRWVELDDNAPACQHVGRANIRFPIDLVRYDVPAMRRVHDHLALATQQVPALNGSGILLEGYSLKAVKDVPRYSSAYPNRDDNLLLSPVMRWTPTSPELPQKAADIGYELRQILFEASNRSELHTYVNYAFGSETTKNMYGYEEWRQARLLELKNKYDPERKFSFYAPIA